MSDLISATFRQLRHWRASLTVGIVAIVAFVVYLGASKADIEELDSRYANAIRELWHSLTRGEAWIAALFFGFLVGTALCEAGYYLFLRLAEVIYGSMDLGQNIATWPRMKRTAFPMSTGEFGVLQRKMRETSEYSDLAPGDESFAYRAFLRDATRNPLAVSDGGVAVWQAVNDSFTNVRLLCGMAGPLSLLIFELAHASGLEWRTALVLSVAGGVVLFAAGYRELGVGLTLLVKNSPIEKMALGLYARDALDRSRGKTERKKAREKSS